jgi:uncharacterized membrane protein required for colicin V production
MLTSGLLSAIALITLVASSVIGLVLGFVTCQVLKVSWNAKMAVTDTAFAFAVVELARGHLEPSLTPILLIAAGSVILRHLIRFGRRSAH